MRKAQEQSLISQYLAQLEFELRSVPESQRESVITDITEHIDEARLEGRRESQIIDGLGPAKQIALALNSAENLVSTGSESLVLDGSVQRRRRLLCYVALFLGLLAAVVIEWMNPLLAEGSLSGASVFDGPDQESTTGSFGAGLVLLLLIPGLLVAAGAILPTSIGRFYSPALALTVTILAKILDLELGLFYLPLVVAAWLIVGAWFIPVRGQRKSWRVTSQIIMILMLLMPPALTLAGILSGAILVDVVPLSTVAVSLACLFGVVRNACWAYWCMVFIGLVALVGAVFSMGMLVLGIWIAGTIYLSCGLIGLLWMNPVHWLSRSA